MDAIARAEQLAAGADLMVCIGSSLVVHPVAGLPELTLAAGGSVAVVTASETPYDHHRRHPAGRRCGRGARGRAGLCCDSTRWCRGGARARRLHPLHGGGDGSIAPSSSYAAERRVRRLSDRPAVVLQGDPAGRRGALARQAGSPARSGPVGRLRGRGLRRRRRGRAGPAPRTPARSRGRQGARRSARRGLHGARPWPPGAGAPSPRRSGPRPPHRPSRTQPQNQSRGAGHVARAQVGSAARCACRARLTTASATASSASSSSSESRATVNQDRPGRRPGTARAGPRWPGR